MTMLVLLWYPSLLAYSADQINRSSFLTETPDTCQRWHECDWLLKLLKDISSQWRWENMFFLVKTLNKPKNIGIAA